MAKIATPDYLNLTPDLMYVILKIVFFYLTRHPRSLNQQDRSNSAPNVCINNVMKPILLQDQRLLSTLSKGPLQVILFLEYFFQQNYIINCFLLKGPIKPRTFTFNAGITNQYVEAYKETACTFG